jgi:uncharacterized protein (TIGR02001 family)
MHHRTIAIAVMTLACGASLNAALAADAVDGAAAPAAPADVPAWTGHVDLVSRYVLRGVTSTYGPGAPLGNAGADAPESDRPALQWGADWSDPSGFYAGYFGAMINYSYRRLGQSYGDRGVVDFQHGKSVENDLYGGYNGKAGDFSYTLGMTGYVYVNGRHANALETKLALGYGEFTLGAQTLLNDVVWGNQGDTYWTLNFTHPLPYAITFNASLGAYSYHKEGKFLGSTDTALGTACPAGQSFFTNGCLAGGAPVSSAWRHLIVGVSQPIAGTPLSWNLQGILGGDNRYGVRQKKQLLASVSYGF